MANQEEGRHKDREHSQLFMAPCSNPLHCIYYTARHMASDTPRKSELLLSQRQPAIHHIKLTHYLTCVSATQTSPHTCNYRSIYLLFLLCVILEIDEARCTAAVSSTTAVSRVRTLYHREDTLNAHQCITQSPAHIITDEEPVAHSPKATAI